MKMRTHFYQKNRESKSAFKTTFLLFLLLGFFTNQSFSQASQGFEGITTALNCGNATCYYFDTGSPAVQHVLVDNNGIPVGLTGAGSNLGFITEFTPSRTGSSGSVGMTDGEAFGVAGSTQVSSELGTTPPAGTQVFLMEDTDGQATMYLDYVDLTGTTSPMMSMQYFAASTSWESSDGANDRFYARVEIDNCAGATTITLLDTDGGGSGGGGGLDMDDGANAIVEGVWTTLSANLTSYVGCRAQLIIEFDANSASEEIGLDAINFTEGTRQPFTLGCSDSDGDGVCDADDVCSGDDATGDSDGDGVCDDLDVCNGGDDNLDADGDGIANFCDACFGDNSTGDTDNDGICDDQDTPTISSSFEEPTGLDAVYVDTGDPQVAHFLADNGAGQPEISYVYGGGELGFTTYFVPTRTYNPGVSGDGLTDGDEVGVTTETTIVGAFTDASQGFKFEDPDGKMILYMDAVDLTGATSPTISVDYFLRSTGYETSAGVQDNFRIYVDVDNGSSTIDLINTAGSDINDLGIEGSWNTLNANLAVGTLIRLIVEADFDSASEELFIDNIIISGGGTVVPGPPCIAPTISDITGDENSICPGGTATLSLVGNLNNAANWQWYTGSCGGTSAGTGASIMVSPATTTTYYVRGEGNCVGTSEMCTTVTVTVEDLMAPSISCPSTQTEPGNAICEGTLSDYTGLASVSDNCDASPTVTQSPLPGSSFAGSQTVTLVATDASGNSTSCTFMVTVSDITAPSITCPSNQSRNVDANCNYTLEDLTGLVSTSDNCDVIPTVTQNPVVGFTPSTTGAIPMTMTATDAAGNTAKCNFLVLMNDNIAPSITCPGTQTETADANCEATLSDYTSLASASDNCDASPNVTQSQVAGTTINGNTNVTLVATDASGNSTSCTFTVELDDTIVPSITCPGTQTVPLDANCVSSHNNYTGLATVSDNCDASPMVTQSPPDGTLITANTTATLIVTDASGNSTSCTFNVEVVDNNIPSISCPANQFEFVDANCEVSLPDYTSLATANDNCDPNPSITQNITPGTTLSIGNETIVLTATDASGNSVTCSFNFLAIDNILPTGICPGPLTVECAEDVPLPDVSLVGATDNCGGSFTAAYINDVSVGFNPEIVTRTYEVTDASGNTNFCTQTITVEDETAPTFSSCPGNQTVSLDANCQFEVPDYISQAGITDNCINSLILPNAIIQSPAVGQLIDANTPVVITVTDRSGNSNVCSFNLSLVDDTPPEIACKNIEIELGPGGNVTISPSQVTASSSDNCGIQSSFVFPNNFSAAGSFPVTLTVIDESGNSSTCNANVIVSKRTTVLLNLGVFSGQYSDQVVSHALLIDLITGDPIANKTINFSLAGENTVAVTNASGIATTTA